MLGITFPFEINSTGIDRLKIEQVKKCTHVLKYVLQNSLLSLCLEKNKTILYQLPFFIKHQIF